jgi:two-component sensor histidine kinase
LDLLASRVVHGVVQSMVTDKHIEVVVAPCEESVLVGAKQAFKLALTLNELATNSIKYAFGGQEEGRIEIKIGREANGVLVGRLEYRDNGRGWPQDVLSGEREGTGLYLVRSTIEYEMEGQVVLSNDGGAVTSCKFNLDQAY